MILIALTKTLLLNSPKTGAPGIDNCQEFCYITVTMSGEQYRFKGRGVGHGDGNKARRLDRVRSNPPQEHSKADDKNPQRIVATFNGPKIKTIARELREIRGVHPEAIDKDTILPFLPEESRKFYGRAIDVMLQVAREGHTIYELGEAIVRSETLPDGTVREMQPECKYLNSAPTGE